MTTAENTIFKNGNERGKGGKGRAVFLLRIKQNPQRIAPLDTNISTDFSSKKKNNLNSKLS